MSTRPQLPVTQLYRKLEIVGKGAYGSVHRGIRIATGEVVALKIINLDTPDDDVEDIQREVALLSQLRGPGANNVTKYYGCYLDGPRVWIVMDFASGGSVRTLMKATKANVVEERYSVIIVRELLVALAYLHKSGVIHRDIKAANVLVTDQGRVLLCDFGVSALLATTQSKRNTFVGTPYWMAPEVITSGSLYDAKADVWSLGITLYEMVTGSPPHSNQVEMRVLALIPSTKPPRLAEHEGSKDMRDFLAACLKELPGERATAEELSKARWIKSAAKTPVSVLKELIVLYENWSRAGGIRKSLLHEDAAEDDESIRTGKRESTWEFDTVRARGSVAIDPDDPQADSAAPSGRDEMSPPRVPPRSLRMLFEDSENPKAGGDKFRLLPQIPQPRITPPAPPAPSSTSALDTEKPSQDNEKTIKQIPLPSDQMSSPPLGSLPSVSPSPLKQHRLSDPATARQPTFAFPAAATPRPRSNTRAPLSSSEDEASEQPPQSARTPTYREVRSTRRLPDISIPPNPRAQQHSGEMSSRSPSPTLAPFPSAAGVRNDSIASGSSASTIRRVRKVAVASPVNFQFPPTSRAHQGSQSKPLPPMTSTLTSEPMEADLEVDAEPLPASSGSSSSHQATHSLDNTNGKPFGLPVPHPPFARAHSATLTDPRPLPDPVGRGKGAMLSRGPSLNRQGSVAVMETVMTPPSVAPLRINRNRSGSTSVSAGGYRSEGEGSALRAPPVALRDVLKLSPLRTDIGDGAADLLPPSPSVMSPPMPSRLPAPHPAPANTAHAPADHPPLQTTTAPPSVSNADALQAHSELKPPTIRPLDFMAFVASPAETHVELARTVDELSRWLAVVETGLAGILERAAAGGTGENGIIEQDAGGGRDGV
ncbi:kinase-like protein [Ramaria rubella]|nr:kinase-like protein [Ramaria rubella]